LTNILSSSNILPKSAIFK